MPGLPTIMNQTSSPDRPSRRVAVLFVALCVALLHAVGCGGLQGPVGELTLHPGAAGPGEPLASQFDHGLYRYDDADTLTLVLVQGSFDQPERALTMRMFWRPIAGSTPIERTATNTTIHYMNFEPGPDGDRRVAIYSGAGFLYPQSTAGNETFHASLWDATVRLTDASTKTLDPLGGPATLTGNFSVQRDDAGVARALRQLNIAVAEALRYPRLVRADSP